MKYADLVQPSEPLESVKQIRESGTLTAARRRPGWGCSTDIGTSFRRRTLLVTSQTSERLPAADLALATNARRSPTWDFRDQAESL